MTAVPAAPPPEASEDEERAAARAERSELLAQIQDVLEPVMVGLGLVFLALLIVDYAGWAGSAAQAAWLNRALDWIYWAFLGDFLLRFAVAPAKGRFLRANWLTVVSLALPALRPLRALRALRGVRALRAARAARSLRLVRLVGGANRGMRALRRLTGGRRFLYVATLSVAVTLLGAGGALFFEREADGSPLGGFGEALWWAATLVTTINSGAEPVSFEGRAIGFLLRLYAVSVFGLITASIATYFIGRAGESEAAAPAAAERDAATAAELAALRREVAALRAELTTGRVGVRDGADEAARTGGAGG
jgi:voltage-gated potassium channel